MKAMRNKVLMKKVAILSSLLVATIAIGHGCSKLDSASNSDSSSQGNQGTTGGNGPGGGFTPFPNANTISLVYNKQIVDNMVSCSGIGLPSAATTAEWTKRQSSFSEYGYATDITAPMLIAITAVAGEICNDLLNIETTLPAASRRVFPGIDFSAGPASIGGSQVADVTRRIARSCWARNEEATELVIVQEEVTAALAGVTMSSTAETRNAALLICTGMLASLSGITL